jgi:hypothetical protein
MSIKGTQANDVIRMFMDRMDRFGKWEDGCFYYGGKSASELQEPIEQAVTVLRSEEAKQRRKDKLLREAAEAMLRDAADHGDLG